ncbi:MAG: hypothetical protein VX624_19340 [Pseudomonadota bacterium]|nr:hypothetical protein [Pseudomonadota bacterium]
MIKVPTVMLRPIFVFIAAAMLAVPVLAQTFVPGFEDVPLMPGLNVIPDSSHVFETPAGRLIEVRAAGAVSAAALETFYRDTMPALGWSRDPDGSFVQTNEVLVIEHSGAGGNLAVTFRLSPRTK